MPGPPLHWIAILACSPVLLALRLTTTPRRGRIETRRDRWIDLGYGAIVSFIYSWILALAVASAGAETFILGLGVGALLYAGIRVATMCFYAGFEGTRSPAWWLKTAIQLITYALLGGLLAIWR